MVRTKKSKPQVVTIDLTRLTKDGLGILQRYVDHGQRLPTVSAKTSYKFIWRHTKVFNTARKTMTTLASRIQSSSGQATMTYGDDVLALPEDRWLSFLETQSRLMDDLLDDCETVVQICGNFDKESESDLVKLKDEVTRLKVATSAKERRDLLLELTRAAPVIAQVKDVFAELLDGLKAIQHELEALKDKPERKFDRVLYIWGVVFSAGVQLFV
ncbi:Adenylosuccinate lyase [Mycena sanguinolenta]|uniref:Adenylosuccinate lyase n=1 Tax=Mycena sanguinolenta TaxID=230812 RepID=A0A8H6XU77_9AGAR|nr:Adenylosuccinate lyase [Mycena sanguinolenta]